MILRVFKFAFLHSLQFNLCCIMYLYNSTLNDSIKQKITIRKKMIYLKTLTHFFFSTLLFIFFLVLNFSLLAESTKAIFNDSIITRIVRGNSMSPLVKNGQEIKIDINFYNNKDVSKNDIVYINHPSNKNNLIKIIIAIPNDKFKLDKYQNGYSISVNDKTARNSEGKTYIFTTKEYSMFKLYEDSYKGVIPPNSYIVLGDNINNSLDSRKFGLIDRSNIIGKILLLNK